MFGVAQKLQYGSRLSAKIPQNFLIGPEFELPSRKGVLGKTVLVPSVGRVSLHIVVYIMSTVDNVQGSFIYCFL